MVIRVLPPEVINQIAAGEVVERPFSVLKELVENAIDAGATQITVDLEEGGRELLRVQDDGRGMAPEDLELVFVSHATSKLASVEDLDAIVSMGFRGEALASIGSVARVRILSRMRDEESGHEVRAEGGRIGEVGPAAAPPGTLVEVRDLFYNVPARRRFLKRAAAERARCLEVFTRLALAHPDCGFTLRGKRELRLPAGEGLARRLGRLYGKEVESRLLAVEHEREGVKLHGYVVDPDGARRDRSQQLLFLNGRPIQDRSLGHALEQGFREYLMHGRHAVGFLFLSMDPASVDVNVHPQKSEVRFHQSRLVYSVVMRGVQQALTGRRARLSEVAREQGAGAMGLAPATGFPDLPAELFGRSESGVPTSFRGGERASGGGPVHEGRVFESRGEVAPLFDASTGSTPAPVSPGSSSPFQGVRRFLVIRDLYILFETDQGLAIVDQHALHERVIYERLLTQWREGSVPIQGLLVPALIDLPPADKELLLDRAEDLERCGLKIGDFGGNTLKLEGYPAALRHVDPKGLLEGFLVDLREGQVPSEPEDLRERFHSAACRSAIMSGDKLTESEIADLLSQAVALEQPDNCPHGRPTVLNISEGQLEHWFRRTL